ncbi:phage tail tube protein [Pseudacidovorax intermedius]|uniref:Uncharacterized protein n=1 Tax=Pseudacidovorax intermedius TaxID=433924 RepID=A0A147GWK3_9BURK|nr:phage tail tube protein [Pseudacidovorax intermedius]KTT21900.1 hypothetical protein NS331_11100 [Pseudacidovorax intermedius]
MSLITRRMAILAKIEATLGVDAIPTGAADAMLVGSPNLSPLEGDEVERDIVRPYFGAGGSVLATQFRKLSFAVELAGVGAAGDLPGYAALLRACAMSATVAANTSATFAPVTDGLESLSIYANMDGVNHALLGARGSYKLDISAKALPKFEFEFTGAYVPPADTPRPAAVYPKFLAPLPVNKANTTLALDGFTAAASAFSLDAGNTVVKRDLINVDTTEITGRKSTGSVTFEATLVGTKAWVEMARASAIVPLALRHGQGATNVVEVKSTRAQLGKPSYSDVDGIQMITIPLVFVPASGNDEFSIIVR